MDESRTLQNMERLTLRMLYRDQLTQGPMEFQTGSQVLPPQPPRFSLSATIDTHGGLNWLHCSISNATAPHYSTAAHAQALPSGTAPASAVHAQWFSGKEASSSGL